MSLTGIYKSYDLTGNMENSPQKESLQGFKVISEPCWLQFDEIGLAFHGREIKVLGDVIEPIEHVGCEEDRDDTGKAGHEDDKRDEVDERDLLQEFVIDFRSKRLPLAEDERRINEDLLHERDETVMGNKGVVPKP